MVKLRCADVTLRLRRTQDVDVWLLSDHKGTQDSSGRVLTPSPDQKKTSEENAHTKNTQPWGITDNQVLTDSGRAGCGHEDRTRPTTVRHICLPLLTLIPFPRDNVGMDASVKPESQKMPLLDAVLGYP